MTGSCNGLIPNEHVFAFEVKSSSGIFTEGILNLGKVLFSRPFKHHEVETLRLLANFGIKKVCFLEKNKLVTLIMAVIVCKLW